VSGAAHVPHWSTFPHPSPTGPQFTPRLEHVLAVHDGAPHTLLVPPPPQVWLPVHVPQLAVRPPHPSAASPQFTFRDAHVAGVQLGAPQTPGVPPPPQVSPLGHVPQLTIPPQPLPVGPHWMFAGHTCGTHALASPTPHTPGLPPPPQVVPAGQVPHEIVPPQPSPVGPHWMPAGQVVAGVQPVEQVPFSQISGEGHEPQVRDPPHPLGHSPQTTEVGHAAAGAHVAHCPATQEPFEQVPQLIELPHPSG
jgi:hypothetical protein